MSENEVNTEKLVADLKTVVRDAEELLKTTAGDVGERARAAREKLNEAVDQARVTCRQLEQSAYERAEAAEQAIREHPFQALGMAFGTGFILGVLLNRR